MYKLTDLSLIEKTIVFSLFLNLYRVYHLMSFALPNWFLSFIKHRSSKSFSESFK